MTMSAFDLVAKLMAALLFYGMLAVIFVLAFAAGRETHAYERCIERHQDPLSVSECVWLMTEGG